ncbi:paraquat-inducible protein B, partial [Vibrio vulnificus]
VEPGKGKAAFSFELANKPPNPTGTMFTLQSEHRGSVSVGTPILYRDMEVGSVSDVQLGKFADRVVFSIEIQNEYAYLVRQNSLFWNVSGVDVSIGLSGANIKAGSFDSLVRGGIAFATPPQKQLEPIAQQGQAFFLYDKAQEEWKKWRTAIPKP